MFRRNSCRDPGTACHDEDLSLGRGWPPTETLWAYADQSGTIATWGRVLSNAQNSTLDFDLRHKQFDTFGQVQPLTGTFGSNTPVLLRAETIFQGWRAEPVTGMFEAGGRLYDPVTSRFTTPGPVSPESPNPYLLGNNDPLNMPKQHEDPSAFGAWGAFGYGVGDTLTFGLFDQAVSAQSEAMRSGWY